MREGDLPQWGLTVATTGLSGGAISLPSHCRGVVAIPACNEEARIGACLAALAVQRDGAGSPLPEGTFAVLVFANNCDDGTIAEIERWRGVFPFPLIVETATLPAATANAGHARKAAMDAAATILEDNDRRIGILFTTDADSAVCSTWISSTLTEMAAGADAVAGYIEAQPAEIMALGHLFNLRGRLEDTYLACMAEMLALCDPLPHDPWPNHRVASGASLAVTLRAYRSIGGLPPRPVGEDIALAEALIGGGFKLRHALHITVTTSSRLDGRAPGGAADTMKLRRDEPEAPCDDDMEPALTLLRRWSWKARLRAWHDGRRTMSECWAERLALRSERIEALANDVLGFETLWRALESESLLLQRRDPLRPSQLARETAIARRVLRLLRRRATRNADNGQAERHLRAGQTEAFSLRPSQNLVES